MSLAENKDNTRDLLLRISPSRNTLVVEEHKPGGIISYREIDPLELYYISMAAMPATKVSIPDFFRRIVFMCR